MTEDRSGNLWLATSGNSVLLFEKKKRQFSKPVLKESGRTILALCMDKDGIIWAGRQGGGLLKIDPVTFRYEEDERYENLYAQLPHAAVTSLFKDRKNNIWFGSWDNVLYRYNYK
jgi:ligand-binding sensor domain-containing protein